MRENCVHRVLGGVVFSGVVLGAVFAGGVPAVAEPEAGSVTGRIWFDRDSDGEQDEGEPGYQWWKTITVMKGDQFIGYFDTDEKGRYTVPDLAPGKYRVGNMQSGVFAETTAPYQDITIPAGGTAEVDFGMRGGSLSGTVWVDKDGNGELESTDERRSGALVKMVGPAGLTGETTSSENGEYTFQDLPNGGNYHVIAPAPEPGLAFSPAGDINPDTGESEWMSIWRGTDLNADIAYVAPADFAVGTPVVEPNRTSFAVGEEFTVKVPVTNKGTVTDKFMLGATYNGLEVLEVTGAAGLTQADESDKALAPNESTTVTVRFRATAAGLSDNVLFQVYGVYRFDTNPKNDTVTVPITVTAASATATTTTPAPVQQVANPAPQKKAAPVHHADLASTGASPVLPLTVGAGLLVAGAGMLLLLRRRGARR